MNIVERAERVAGRISDKVEHFVTHLGGDYEWGGEERVGNNSSETPQRGVKTLLERAKLFNPQTKDD